MLKKNENFNQIYKNNEAVKAILDIFIEGMHNFFIFLIKKNFTINNKKKLKL